MNPRTENETIRQANPRVSIVMSVFNDAERICQSVESLIAQTYQDWELVLINDGSTDQTGEILKTLAERDRRIRVIHQENTGLTRALIRGCAESRGDIIARQDADDLSHPERLSAQVALLDSDAEIGFVSCWTKYVGPANELLEVLKRHFDSQMATKQLLESRQGPPAHGSVTFRRKLYNRVGGYRKEFYFGQDSDLWLRMAEQSRIAYVPKVLYVHRRSPGSISGALRSVQHRFGEFGHACRQARLERRSEASILDAAQSLTDEVRERRARDETQEPDASHMEYLIGSRLAQNGDPRASRYLWPVLKRRPWHWKAWVRLVQSQLSFRGTAQEGSSDE